MWPAPSDARRRRSAPAATVRGSPVAGSLELATRLGQEYVVERRLVQLQRLHPHVVAVQQAHDLRELRLSAGQLHGDAPAAVVLGGAEAAEEPRQPAAGVGLDRRDLHARAADLRLELSRCALRDDLAAIDDPDP